jgi:hypothetical protein
MNHFVNDCRQEWKRLGVPQALSNEMAADLEADLAEAQADGVSPEEVLGNGFFDAKSFAASWATARGIVSPRSGVRQTIRFQPWMLAVSALACLGAAALGLAILVGRRMGSSSAAPVAFRHAVYRRVPEILVSPHQIFFMGPSRALEPLGWILLVVGLVGLGTTLWIWKPWAAHRSRPEFDQNIGMPSFL